MKKTIIKLFIFAAAMLAMTGLTSCDMNAISNEGIKTGKLQNVTHRNDIACSYYVVEVAYAGGKITSQGSTWQCVTNEEFGVTKEAYDTLLNHVGESITFKYEQKAMVLCGLNSTIASVKIN